jgi:hypothetical protein
MEQVSILGRQGRLPFRSIHSADLWVQEREQANHNSFVTRDEEHSLHAYLTYSQPVMTKPIGRRTNEPSMEIIKTTTRLFEFRRALQIIFYLRISYLFKRIYGGLGGFVAGDVLQEAGDAKDMMDLRRRTANPDACCFELCIRRSV